VLQVFSELCKGIGLDFNGDRPIPVDLAANLDGILGFDPLTTPEFVVDLNGNFSGLIVSVR
jgi:hypothetical protein